MHLNKKNAKCLIMILEKNIKNKKKLKCLKIKFKILKDRRIYL